MLRRCSPSYSSPSNYRICIERANCRTPLWRCTLHQEMDEGSNTTNTTSWPLCTQTMKIPQGHWRIQTRKSGLVPLLPVVKDRWQSVEEIQITQYPSRLGPSAYRGNPNPSHHLWGAEIYNPFETGFLCRQFACT